MRILYTYEGLAQKVGGVSRYFFELITRFTKTDDVQICSHYSSNEYFKDIIKGKPFSLNFKYSDFIRIFTEDICTLWHLLFNKYDVLHLTGENNTAIRWSHKPVVLTVHDMIPELMFDKKRRWVKHRINKKRYAIEHSDAIICVSENTKKDLLNLYPTVDENKITVIHHGYTPMQTEYSKPLDFRYILYVGGRQDEYKNFIPFVKAVAPILKKYSLTLVCAGSLFTEAEHDLFRQLGIDGYVYTPGYVINSELASLYHFAECFVYPSKYEGFGIPIFEAFCNECPACISNASCFPEVGEDAVEYFDPDNIESIRATIEKVILDKSLRERLINNGNERLKECTWDITAQKTMEVYKKVINEHSNTNNLL